MRSDHADPALRTEVRLDFSVADKRYRVQRSPWQERPKRRGDGFTVENPSAALWDRSDTPPGDPTAEGTPLATKPTDVTERVEQILGFRSVQFRQVVMLPQGKFQELLQSSGKEREEILQRLFRTERYRELQDALKAEAQTIEREVQTGQGRPHGDPAGDRGRRPRRARRAADAGDRAGGPGRGGGGRGRRRRAGRPGRAQRGPDHRRPTRRARRGPSRRRRPRGGGRRSAGAARRGRPRAPGRAAPGARPPGARPPQRSHAPAAGARDGRGGARRSRRRPPAGRGGPRHRDGSRAPSAWRWPHRSASSPTPRPGPASWRRRSRTSPRPRRRWPPPGRPTRRRSGGATPSRPPAGRRARLRPSWPSSKPLVRGQAAVCLPPSNPVSLPGLRIDRAPAPAAAEGELPGEAAVLDKRAQVTELRRALRPGARCRRHGGERRPPRPGRPPRRPRAAPSPCSTSAPAASRRPARSDELARRLARARDELSALEARLGPGPGRRPRDL